MWWLDATRNGESAMNLTISIRRRIGLVVVLALPMLLAPSAVGHAGSPPSVPYLALGDSVPYGWDAVNPPGAAAEPSFHVGYPEVLAARSPLEVVNAACPGETTAHFFDLSAGDNGCSFVVANFGIKTDWGAGDAQFDFALEFLQANPDTGLVTISLGANDFFICQADPVDGCTEQEFMALLGTIGQALGSAIAGMRAVGYNGQIVLVSYYALDYADPTARLVSQATATVYEQVASAFDGVTVADGFGAFEVSSRRSSGDPCAAGLLLELPGSGCDVHTSPRGDAVLARAVHRAVDVGAIGRGLAP